MYIHVDVWKTVVWFGGDLLFLYLVIKYWITILNHWVAAWVYVDQ